MVFCVCGASITEGKKGDKTNIVTGLFLIVTGENGKKRTGSDLTDTEKSASGADCRMFRIKSCCVIRVTMDTFTNPATEDAVGDEPDAG